MSISDFTVPYEVIRDLKSAGFAESPLRRFFTQLSEKEQQDWMTLADELRAGPQANTPPGLILDVWVTQFVMGYRLRCKPHRSNQTGEVIAAWDYHAGPKYSRNLGRTIDDWKPILRYSMDYHASFLLVQRLTQEGSPWSRLEILTATAQGDPCRVRILAHAGPEYDRLGEGPTVPHAICVAALQTVGVESPAAAVDDKTVTRKRMPMRSAPRYGHGPICNTG